MYYSIEAHLIDILFTVTDDIMNISFDLSCISQGGPVNEMLWLYNDEPINNSNRFPTLADAKIGWYYNSFSVHGRLTGNYTCRITDEMSKTIGYTSHIVKGKNVYNVIID